MFVDTKKLSIGVNKFPEHDNSFEVAGKIFVNDNPLEWLGNLGVNGYQKLPSGLILQWGTFTGSGTKSFNIPFPNACLTVLTSGMVAYQGSSPQYITISGCQTWTNSTFEAASVGFFNVGGAGTTITSQAYQATQGIANFGGTSRWIAIGF